MLKVQEKSFQKTSVINKDSGMYNIQWSHVVDSKITKS